MTLPSSWNQVTLKQFCDIQDTVNADMNMIRKNNIILSALLDCPLHEIEALPFKTTVDMSEKLGWMANLPDKLLKDFELNGVRYKVQYEIFKATTGQYADLCEFLKKDGWYKFAECCAVMCVPEGESYDSSKVEERAAMFWESLTVDVFYPMTSFFLLLSDVCVKITQFYSTHQRNQKMLKMQEELIDSLEEMINS